jgi:hypothetical protein
LTGFYYVKYQAPYESTDDAYIEAHVTPVTPQVAGRVEQVLVRDAQAQSDRAVAENLIALYKVLGGGWEVAGLNQAGGMPGKK